MKVDFSFKIHCDTSTKVYFNQKMFQQQGKWYKQRPGHQPDRLHPYLVTDTIQVPDTRL